MRLLLLIALSIAAVLGQESEVLKEFAIGNNDFSADVYKELMKAESGNFLVCPLSAEIILALVHAGSEGKTAKELSNGLHLPENKEKIQQIIQELTPYLQGNESYTLSSANKIYVKNGYKIKDHFKTTAVNVFKSEIQNIDFEKKQQAVLEMNKWVEEKTHDKIKNLISEDNLDDDTRAVLINAMYFHGKWSAPFKKEMTRKIPFYVNGQDHVEIDMMEQVRSFKYHESIELNAKFLELDYAGDDVTITFVLPNDKTGLPDLESHINDVFTSPQYDYPKVHVVIPKFKIETKIDFTQILQSLGVVESFTDAAKFPDIIVDERLKISEVVQKTFVEVEEEGTTAAAATGVIMTVVTSSLNRPTPIQQFIADHPFIFYIKVKDVIMFAGRYTSATE